MIVVFFEFSISIIRVIEISLYYSSLSWVSSSFWVILLCFVCTFLIDYIRYLSSSVSYTRSSIFNTCSHWSLLVDLFFLPSPLLCLLSSSLSIFSVLNHNEIDFMFRVESVLLLLESDFINIIWSLYSLSRLNRDYETTSSFHVETLQELYGISWFFLWYVSDFTIDMSLDLSWNPLSCKNTISFSVLLLDSSYVVIVCVSCSTISCISVREIIFSRYDRQHIEIFLDSIVTDLIMIYRWVRLDLLLRRVIMVKFFKYNDETCFHQNIWKWFLDLEILKYDVLKSSFLYFFDVVIIIFFPIVRVRARVIILIWAKNLVSDRKENRFWFFSVKYELLRESRITDFSKDKIRICHKEKYLIIFHDLDLYWDTMMSRFSRRDKKYNCTYESFEEKFFRTNALIYLDRKNDIMMSSKNRKYSEESVLIEEFSFRIVYRRYEMTCMKNYITELLVATLTSKFQKKYFKRHLHFSIEIVCTGCKNILHIGINCHLIKDCKKMRKMRKSTISYMI